MGNLADSDVQCPTLAALGLESASFFSLYTLKYNTNAAAGSKEACQASLEPAAALTNVNSPGLPIWA
jgi:hypothetical protein